MSVSNDPVFVFVSSLLMISLFILPFILFRKRKNYKVLMTVYVLCLVFTMRLAVTLLGNPEGTENLNLIERIFDSFIHSLQTFSMDEGYTEYTKIGKEILSDQYSSWAFVYGIFVSILNILAPVIGGALLLEILTGLFPTLRIVFHPFKCKYIFSELNEMSVTLAEDMYNKNYPEISGKSFFKPLLVFTDTYVDNESEVRSELYARAKRIGAVCVNTDLLELDFSKSKAVTYLLIDKKSGNNIAAFSNLIRSRKKSEKENNPFLRALFTSDHLFPISKKDSEPKTKIIAFVQEESESDTIHHILNSSDIKDYISVRAIRDYMNAAINMAANVPLFLPLLYSSVNKTELNITIIGSGSIAREAFKTIYWCGQMDGVALNVTVLSNNASDMEVYLNEYYTEMMECCKAGSDKLRIHEKDKPGTVPEKNPPYLNTIKFVDIDDVTILSSEAYKDILKNTDYYVIALGSDSLDHKLTSMISRELSLLRLKQQAGLLQTGCPENVIIVPAIFDTSLAESIQASMTTVSKNNQTVLGTAVIPFATLKERFSCQNVFFTSFSDDALSTNNLYAKKQSGKCSNDEYSWLADIVKEVHVPYKLYGINALKQADGNVDIKERPYYIINSSGIEVSPDKYYKMAWIEHRRWNAFLRSQGFSAPDWKVFDRYCKAEHNHKNIPLRLHPCLVEYSITPTPCIDLNGELSDLEYAPYDRLDYASVRIYQTLQQLDQNASPPVPEDKRFKLPQNSGYKAYDYYGYYETCERKNERNETIIDRKWVANDYKLNELLKPQPIHLAQ